VKAVVVETFGPPGVLQVRDVPEPRPGSGEVVIESRLISVTFVETQVRAGRPPNPAMLPELPYTPGNGVGGTITHLGPGVDAELLGCVAVATTGGRGGYAEQALVRADDLLLVPDGLKLSSAVALLADGRTALALLRTTPIQAGEPVLVLAAAGGVGACLVQLAKHAGARVYGAASTDAKREAVRALGADLVADYSASDWADTLRKKAGEMAVVFDGVGGALGEQAAGLLNPGGRLCRFGMASGTFAQPVPADVVESEPLRLAPDTMRALSQKAMDLAAQGQLRPLIGQVLPLEQAADAHRLMEQRAVVGKTLLKPGRL
jgi:NADPH2:quinone reductase